MGQRVKSDRVTGLVTVRWDAEAVLLRSDGNSERYVMADAPWPSRRMPAVGQQVELVFDDEGCVCDWKPSDLN